MKVISLKDDTHLQDCYAATIGFFDGVHLGHRYVLQQLRQEAERHGWPSMAITFDRHPRQVVDTSWHPQLLTTLDEKVTLLQQTGIDILTVLTFNETMAQLSAHDFMLHVLKEQLGVRLLLTGYDNHFGHRTAGSHEGFDDYVRYGRELNIDVVCAKELQPSSSAMPPGSSQEPSTSCFHVSSSQIRRLLCGGRVDEAAQCLGRCYSLKGTVEHGFQQGRAMGFPTANIHVDPSRLVPADGVYAVRVGLSPTLQPFTGITNIGMRPTFNGHQRTIETHIFDFEGDIYGTDIEISFAARLRDEQHFQSADELAQQMAHDAEAARRFFSTTNGTKIIDLK